MLDISWGETGFLIGLGLVLIGRRDLPLASHTLGKQIGRIVGLLQGARLRADRFAHDHQLKALQNEFRSGLRELDAVKAELAGAMLNNNRGMGAMVPGVDRRRHAAVGSILGAASADVAAETVASVSALEGRSGKMSSISPERMDIGAEYLAAAQQAEVTHSNPPISGGLHYDLAPKSRSIAAVAEEEWEKQGIGFQSIAERGNYKGIVSSDPSSSNGVKGGAIILSNFIRQSLIYDQYERTVREQDEALRSRVDKVRQERSDAINTREGKE